MPPIIAADNSKTFTPAPPGLHQGVCCDVVDLGNVATAWGEKHKVSLRWQIDALTDDGKPFLVVKRYTLSLNDKATLRHDLESWRGKAFTDEELKGFDLERLIGVNAWLNIVQNEGADGQVYANVMALAPVKKEQPKMQVSGDYVRVVNRDAGASNGDQQAEIPF